MSRSAAGREPREKRGKKYTPAETIAEMLPSIQEDSLVILQSRRIVKPSPIQALAIPRLLGGMNAILHAETGSGKTMAFLLPLLERARSFEEASDEPSTVLVLVPTRELAVQMKLEAEDLTVGRVAMVAMSTKPYWSTISEAALVIAQPMELLDVLDKQDEEQQRIFFQRVRGCAIDEFDEQIQVKEYRKKRRTYDQPLGVWPAAVAINRLLQMNDHPDLQIVAASATYSKGSARKLKEVLGFDPQNRFSRGLKMLRTSRVVRTDTEESAGQPVWDKTRGEHERFAALPAGIQHAVWKMPRSGGSHSAALVGALEKLQPKSAIVFVCPSAKESIKLIVDDLQESGWEGVRALTESIFPDSKQSQQGNKRGRKEISAESKSFRSANRLEEMRETTQAGSDGDIPPLESPVIVCSEASARGLHLDAVQAVFVIGQPSSAASYTHMAGRTGRLPYPYGVSVLVARPREAAKVMNGFRGDTLVGSWRELGSGCPGYAEEARGETVAEAATRQRAGVRSRAAQSLDAALWR